MRTATLQVRALRSYLPAYLVYLTVTVYWVNGEHRIAVCAGLWSIFFGSPSRYQSPFLCTAARRLVEGEELFMDYGEGFFKPTPPADDKTNIP